MLHRLSRGFIVHRTKLMAGFLVTCVTSSTAGQAPATHTQSDGRQPVIASVTVNILDKTTLSAPSDGFLAQVLVQPGDLVEAKQLLVRLDTRRLEKQRDMAVQEQRALIVKARNRARELSSAARERTSQQRLEKLDEVQAQYSRSVPELERVDVEGEVEQARAEKEGAILEQEQFQVEAAAKEKAVELLEFDLMRSRVFSLYNGVVAEKYRFNGEFVKKGDPLLEMYRLDRLSGVILIDHRVLHPSRAAGTAVQLKFASADSDALVELDARIERVFPRIDVDGKYSAIVEFDNLRNEATGMWILLPGTTGSAEFTTPN